MKKKVLIAGASGFIGSNLLKKLSNKKNYNLIGTTNKKKIKILNILKPTLKLKKIV